MTRTLIAALATGALLAAQGAAAQPYGAPHAYDGWRAQTCFPHEDPGSCRERLHAERHGHHRYVWRDGRYEDESGAAIALGILGFVLGAAIAGSSHDRDYYEAHRYDHGWRTRCQTTYPSFDYSSGTYLGRDGYRHYCVR